MEEEFSEMRWMLLAGVLTEALFAQPAGPRIQTVAGSHWVGDGGPARDAILLQVQGIAVDGQGNVFLADTDSHRVRRVGLDGTITTVAGTGEPGFSGDGGRAVEARLDRPYGLATDPQGNLYIADLGNGRVRRVRPSGTIDTLAGGGDLLVSETNEGGPATVYRLDSPRNVAVGLDGSVYVSDFGGHRVYRIGPGGWLTQFAGTGEPAGSGDGGLAREARLRSPAGLAVSAAGVVYVADSGNGRVRTIEAGRIRTLVTATVPAGLALDAAGTLFVAESGAGRVLRVPPQGAVTARAMPASDVAVFQGTLFVAHGAAAVRVSASGMESRLAGGGNTAHGDGGPATAARLHFPSGIAQDAAGNLYIADRGNHRVRRVSKEGVITTFAGTGEAGYSGDGGSARQARLRDPMSVAVDAAGFVYIADTGNHAVRRVSANGTITTIAGSGQAGFAGDGGQGTAARLRSPMYVLPDRAGGVYVADTGNQRVRRVLASGRVDTVAGNGKVDGEGDGGPAVEASLAAPRGLALDEAGNLFVTEIDGGRIRRISPRGVIATVGGAGWNGPRAVAVTPEGLLVADTASHRVRAVRGQAVQEYAGTGKAGLSGDGSDPLAAALHAPFDLLVDGEGRVWIADTFNHRVRRIDPQAAGFDPLRLLEVRHAATGEAGPVAPGMLVAVPGAGLTRVEMDGIPAAVSVRGDAVLAVVPEGVRETVRVEAFAGSESRGVAVAPVAEANPGVFAQEGIAAAVLEDGSLMSLENGASRGSVVAFYVTGTGAGPVRVRIGEWEAEVVFAGAAPGLAGIVQVNARMPVGFFAAGRYEMRVEAGGVRSPGVWVVLR